jgi:hypothetical protein
VEYLFTPNDIDRFSIGSTTDGLVTNPDGSLDIYIQHARPDDDHVANWLPAPAESFNLTLRYGPLSTVLDKSYTPPPSPPRPGVDRSSTRPDWGPGIGCTAALSRPM